MRKAAAIIAAGGSGRRMGQAIPKPFLHLCNRPLIDYSLKELEKSSLIDSIVLVVSKNFLKQAVALIAQKRYKKVNAIVPGGPTRAQSVYNGLRAVSEDCSVVLIHDAARPLISQRLLSKCLLPAIGKGINCIAAVPVKATIKKINLKNKYIADTPQRKTLYEAQTPQVFQKKALLSAYKKFKHSIRNFKDDASLLEAAGKRVKIIESDYSNIKITTKEDLKIAEALLRK